MRRTLIGATGAAVGAAAVLAGHALAPATVAEPAPARRGIPAPVSGSPSPAPTPARLVDGTATGPLVGTAYGPVQVRVTVLNGAMTEIKALILPTEHEHSKWIDANLVPQLRKRVLTAQSADVDVISGATYTSGGYLDSLQAALDQLP